eukprot:7111051-Pyramimonas_sp.AAC.1
MIGRRILPKLALASTIELRWAGTSGRRKPSRDQLARCINSLGTKALGCRPRLKRLLGCFRPTRVSCSRMKLTCYGKFWEATSMPEPLEVLDRNCFDRLKPDDIRAASRGFSPHTAQSLDGIHVRHFSLLPDAGLEVLSC